MLPRALSSLSSSLARTRKASHSTPPKGKVTSYPLYCVTSQRRCTIVTYLWLCADQQDCCYHIWLYSPVITWHRTILGKASSHLMFTYIACFTRCVSLPPRLARDLSPPATHPPLHILSEHLSRACTPALRTGIKQTLAIQHDNIADDTTKARELSACESVVYARVGR